MTLRPLLPRIASFLLLAAWVAPAAAAERIPVIYDSDTGDDIDDTWALVMMLKSPQLDVKLISTDCHKANARAKIQAKLLSVAGRTDVPIGLGPGPQGSTRQDEWTKDFDLKQYPGKVHKDGVQAIIDTIHASKKPSRWGWRTPLPHESELN